MQIVRKSLSRKNLFFLFFHNLCDAPDASVTLGNDERNTFYCHHRCVKSQCLGFVNAYLADKSV